jgi:hypothetical protein
MSLVQRLGFIADSVALSKLESELRAAGARGGAALKHEFDRQMADLTTRHGGGLLDDRQYTDQARHIAQVYRSELGAAMDRLKVQGKENTEEYRALQGQMVAVRREGQRSGGLLMQAWGA